MLMRKIDRLSKYMDIKGLNDNKVSKECSLSNGLLAQARKGKCDLGVKAIEKILDKYQDLDKVWLLTGEGEMLVNSSLKSKAPTSKAAKRKILEGIIFNPNHLVTGAVAPACVPRVKESTESDANLKVIKAQEKTIATQERLISVLQAEVERLQRALEEKNNG